MIGYAWAIHQKAAMMAATNATPTRKPITDVRVGTMISRLLPSFVKHRRGAGRTALGSVQGSSTFSSGWTGVRARA